MSFQRCTFLYCLYPDSCVRGLNANLWQVGIFFKLRVLLQFIYLLKLTCSSTGIQILMLKSSWDPNSYAPEVRTDSQQVANAALQGAQEENATPLHLCLCLWARESLHG